MSTFLPSLQECVPDRYHDRETHREIRWRDTKELLLFAPTIEGRPGRCFRRVPAGHIDRARSVIIQTEATTSSRERLQQTVAPLSVSDARCDDEPPQVVLVAAITG
jgi:hypothetical protein